MKELILVSVFVLTFILNLLNVTGATIGFVLSGGILAIIYFYTSVIIFNGIPIKKAFKKDSYKGLSPLRIIGTVGLGISLSVLILGILFMTMSWPGWKFQIEIGLASCLIILIISIIKFFLKKEVFYKKLVIRNLLWIIAAITLYTLPKYTLINIKYSDEPAYRDALINSMKNPNDTSAHRIWVEESKKLNE